MGSDGGPFSEDPESAIKTRFVPQGIGADLIATLEGWSREDVDRFAVRSQKLAAQARDSGWFDHSVVPVKDENGTVVLQRDDFLKPDTDMAALAKLNPASMRWGRWASMPSPWPSTPRSNRSITCTRRATPAASSTAPRW